MTKIYFVRHGDVRNPRNLFYGRAFGFPLSDLGRKQARYAKQYLSRKNIGAIYSSPQLRACETAQIIMKPHKNLVLRITDMINEVHCPFDGKPIEVVKKRDWDVYTGVEPEYEQPEDVLKRGLEFLAGVRLGHSEQEIIAVSHGDLISFLILWANGVECNPENKQRLYKEFMGTGSISILQFETLDDDEIPKVRYVDPSKMDGEKLELDWEKEAVT